MELNQARINGVELFSTYGVGISSGLKNMDQPPKKKADESYNWEDEQGVEYKLNGLLEDSEVTLSCFMKAPSMAEFRTKQAAFENMLRLPAFKSFEVLDSATTHQVKYNEITNYDRKLLNDGSVAATFDLGLTIIRGGYNLPTTQSEFVIDDDMILSVVTTEIPGWELNDNGDLEMITE